MTDSYCALNATYVKVGTSTFDRELKVTLFYENYDSTTNGGVTELNIGMNCDASATITTYNELTNNEGSIFKAQMYGPDCCPLFTYNAIYQFFARYNYLWGTIFILGGLFIGFGGRKHM